MKADGYAQLARYYDLLVPNRQQMSCAAGERLHGILGPLNVRTVLDCTCGTGLQSIPLAQKGYSVTGSDLSRQMLIRARENARAARVSIRWLRGDIRQLAELVNERFDAVITCGNSLLHLPDREDLRKAIRSMHAVTRDGGYTLIESQGDGSEAEQISPLSATRGYLPDGTPFSVHVMTERSGDLANMNVFIARDTGRGPRVTHRSMTLRVPTKAELVALLEEAGFRQVSDIPSRGIVMLLARK